MLHAVFVGSKPDFVLVRVRGARPRRPRQSWNRANGLRQAWTSRAGPPQNVVALEREEMQLHFGDTAHHVLELSVGHIPAYAVQARRDFLRQTFQCRQIVRSQRRTLMCLAVQLAAISAASAPVSCITFSIMSSTVPKTGGNAVWVATSRHSL